MSDATLCLSTSVTPKNPSLPVLLEVLPAISITGTVDPFVFTSIWILPLSEPEVTELEVENSILAYSVSTLKEFSANPAKDPIVLFVAGVV